MASRTPGHSVERLIDSGLELDLFASAETAIGSDDKRGSEILDAGFQRSAENPPNTTLWMMPRRVQRAWRLGSSGIIGM
jgi:hypothetical protein